jgi:4a-hydroxytetrahydrobiopterin dehydratase
MAKQRAAESEISAALARLPGWTREGETITKEWPLGTFKEAISFVNKVADLAEEQNHHPNILIRYKRVRLTLSSHDVGGISERDFALAESVEKIAK